MNCKNLLIGLLFLLFSLNIVAVQAETLRAEDVAQTIEDITVQLSKDLNGHFHTKPLLILIGGFPGAGKTTLITSLVEAHDVTVFSWDAVRQALLDRHIMGSPFDPEILDTVQQNILRICMERHLNVVIDTNAHARKISEIESFLEKEQYGQDYQIVKICLNPPVRTLFDRISARAQKEGLHQGTESDLQRDLLSTKKVMNLNEYALVINTEAICFENEMKIVTSFLEPYFNHQD